MNHNLSDNFSIASAIIETFLSNNINFFTISPGSRSTALTTVLARNDRCQTIVHFDERGASFLALGHAKATGKPTVLVCTSGTAVANYYPAIIEAYYSSTPLIVLTADRPPELQDRGANQTIDQRSIYGKYVKEFIELPVLNDNFSIEYYSEQIRHAIISTCEIPMGIVHINVPIREPFLNDDEYKENNTKISPKEISKINIEPKDVINNLVIEKLTSLLNNSDNGLLLIGRLSTDREREAAIKLANKLNWPVFADAQSGLRSDNRLNSKIEYYDLLLATKKSYGLFSVSTILQIGSRIVSKRLQSFLQKLDPDEHILIDDDPRRHDPYNTVSKQFSGSIVDYSELLAERITGRNNTIESYNSTSENISKILQISENDEFVTEPSLVSQLSRVLPDNSNFFIANSMPIRLVDSYAYFKNRVEIFTNRGASGIDGNLASALGVAFASKKTTTLLIGDLALLHDLNSMSLLKNMETQFIIIVINNNGGGIFDHLPIANADDIFEEYFITKHNYNFEYASKMFDLKYESCDRLDKFNEIYLSAIENRFQILIEVVVDREYSFKVQEDIIEKIRVEIDG